jgi:hypothetical protein
MNDSETDPLDCASEAMLHLVADTLDHGFGSIENIGGPLIPFLILDFGERQELTRMDVDNSEAALVHGARLVSSAGPNLVRYALAYDAFVRINGIRTDAIIVQGSERAMPHGIVFYQSYSRSASGSAALERQGEVGFGGTVDSLMMSSSSPGDAT